MPSPRDPRDPWSPSGEGDVFRRRRTHGAPSGRRDRDLARDAILFRALVGGGPGLLLGAILGVFLVTQGKPLWVAVATTVVVPAFVVISTLLITARSGDAARVLYAPSGRSTPHRKEYSGAESLVARGRYEDAITAFELAIAEDPRDPTPYLRVARIYRDQLGRLEDCARWFRRALREADLQAAPAALAVRRELVELFVHRMKTPGRAAPELARMAEDWAGTPEGEWAARELADVKRSLTGDDA